MIALSLEIAARHPDGAMGGVAAFGELLGEWRLIRIGRFIFLKSKRDGAKNSSLLRGQGRDAG